MARAYVALGSNLGDRLRLLQCGVSDLGACGVVVARSSVWETEAVGPPPDYLNAVVELHTPLGPSALLSGLLDIEARHGRIRSQPQPGAPRTLDLDLLLYDDLVLATPGLVLPHPRLPLRAFVLAPLAELAPDLLHPMLQRSIRDLLAALPPEPRVRRFEQPL